MASHGVDVRAAVDLLERAAEQLGRLLLAVVVEQRARAEGHLRHARLAPPRVLGVLGRAGTVAGIAFRRRERAPVAAVEAGVALRALGRPRRGLGGHHLVEDGDLLERHLDLLE